MADMRIFSNLSWYKRAISMMPFDTICSCVGVTVPVDGPLDAAVCHLVHAATVGHHHIAHVRKCHMLMGEVALLGLIKLSLVK
jgi:hypothetical protein